MRTVEVCILKPEGDDRERSSIDALNIVNKLNSKGVAMVVLNFGGMQIDVSTPTGKLMLTMFVRLCRNRTGDYV
jgi:DNA invertase Pin-like site-specific DNA recombinase